MRYRYDHRVGITGLVLAGLILAAGLLTGHRATAVALAMATAVTSTLVAYVRVPDRPAGPAKEGRRRR